MSRHGLTGLARLAPGQFGVHAASSTVGVVATLLMPAVAASAVDSVLNGGDSSFGLVALAGLLGVRALTDGLGGMTRAWVTTSITVALRRSFVGQVFALGIPGQRRYRIGDQVTRMTAATRTASTGVPGLVTIAVEICASLVGLVALTLIDWWLGVVLVLGVLPIVLTMRSLMRQVTSQYGEYLEHQGDIAARLTDALAGSRTIRASGTSRLEVARILAPLPQLARVGMATWAVQRSISWQLDAMLTGVRVCVLAVCGWGLVQGRVSSGEFLAAALYLGFALAFVYQADTLNYLANSRANADRVDEVLAETPQFLQNGTRELPPGPGALSLRGVCVSHDDRVVLDGVDLEVPAGQAMALVGRSGAGKSTVALLIGRLIDPDQGAVLIDGVRVDTLLPSALRREVAYAFDHPILLGHTIREAITYGSCAGDRAEAAAGIVRAETFIRRLPNGFDTPLADSPMSGGELQRIGLARAVAQGGRVFVLDDATSSLDTVTEAEVTEALTVRLAGRTRVLVAHRATTAARADLVAWLDNGRIRAVATHQTLMATEPEYPKVFAQEEQ